ncbi:MAG: replicative DNA helicase [Elusimicrobia bacterium]|nr:replicative DNA helicase [Elusimicrobiota bacterium]
MALETKKNTDLQIDKVPPQSIEAEMAVLGSMLIEKEAVSKGLEIVNEDDFYSEFHKQIFTATKNLELDSKAIDIITVSEKLKKNKLFIDNGGTSYLTSMINSVSTAANVEHYAEIVRDKSILRKLINAGSNIVNSAFNEKFSAEEILDESQGILFNISKSRNTKSFANIQDLVHDSLNDLEKLLTDKKDVPGLRTGFTDLDKLTSGLQPSDLIILAARPSMGKTALALNIAEYVAMAEKKPVAIFSLEMSKKSLMLRLLCSAARVNSHQTRKGFISRQNWINLTTIASKIADAPIYIDDSSSLTVLDIRARSRRLASELALENKKLELIIIDYIQIMRGTGRIESRQQEMSDISRALKGLAKDLNIPVIAVSQLSRKPEEKGREGRPQLSDLRDSGALEQDADVVAFIYRAGYYKTDDPDNEKVATIILGKQRNGPTGEVTLVFEKDYTRFENFTPQQEIS